MAGLAPQLINELDTICAVSSPAGEGAISIIRASGKESLPIFKNIFEPYKNRVIPRTVHTGRIKDPFTLRYVDEVNAVFFKGPGTYTGEDMFEIYPHGGIFNTRYILEIIIKSGARLAMRGEFTKRAYINGKIDVLKAEAVLEIIKSTSIHNLLIANNQLSGLLGERIKSLKDDFLYLLALIEALIDFSDEELEDIDAKFLEKASRLENTLTGLIDSYAGYSRFEGGPSVVIAGAPNAGKSSLLNALLRKKRAIVHDVPGTTRDYIEEVIFLFNKPLKIVDTAGLRESGDLIEREGINLALEQIEKSDLIIYVFDPGKEFMDFSLGRFKDKIILFVLNKVDLLKEDEIKRYQKSLSEITGGKDIIPISASDNTGIEQLKTSIYERILELESISEDEVGITTLRQKTLIEKCLDILKTASRKFKNKDPLEIISIDLREALFQIDEITGAVSNEDILDTLFREFCIGK